MCSLYLINMNETNVFGQGWMISGHTRHIGYAAVTMAVKMAVKRENLDLESFEELEIVCG